MKSNNCRGRGGGAGGGRGGRGGGGRDEIGEEDGLEKEEKEEVNGNRFNKKSRAICVLEAEMHP